MDVNLGTLQDAGVGSYSGTVQKNGISVTSAPEAVNSTADTKLKSGTDTAKYSEQGSRQKVLSRDELENVTTELNKFMQNLNTDISFSIHEKTGRLMVQVKDSKGAVVKEFPSHELLDTIAAISEQVGALLDKKV